MWTKHRARRGDGRRGQVDLARRIAHAADEVAVRRGDGALAGGKDAHVAAQAGTTGGRGYGAVRIEEHVHEALLHALAVHGLRGGDHDAAHVGVDLPPAQHVGGLAHVDDAAVRAAADDGLVDLNVARLGGRARVRRQMRERHGGHDGGGVDLVNLRVRRIGVGVVLGVGALGAAVHIGARHVVDLDEAGLTARFDGHIRDAHALVHAHAPNGAAGEFHGLVERARPRRSCR